jgi:hypothetical protein
MNQLSDLRYDTNSLKFSPLLKRIVSAQEDKKIEG